MGIFRSINGEHGRQGRRLNTEGCGAFVIAVLLAAAPMVRGGTLTTLDGNNFDGTIAFEKNDTLLVAPNNAPPLRIALRDVLAANIIPENRQLLRGVILTSGEAIAANAVTQVDDSGVRLVRPGGIPLSLPASDVACVIFRPVTAETLKHIPAGHAGAILDNGDFFEGDAVGFDGNQVKISSVLFGIQSFDVGHAARGVILQDAAPPMADEVIHLVDGSVLLGTSASCTEGRLTVEDARLGTITLEARLIASMTAGGSAFDSLVHRAPSKVDGAPLGYAMDSTIVNVPMALLGASAGHGIGQRPGVSLTWDLEAGYKSVIARAGVPLGLVPVQHLQFVVRADGKEVFRSPPQSSVDDPASIAVSLVGVKTLTFCVEGADPMAPGAVGLWADPILVRNSK